MSSKKYKIQHSGSRDILAKSTLSPQMTLRLYFIWFFCSLMLLGSGTRVELLSPNMYSLLSSGYMVELLFLFIPFKAGNGKNSSFGQWNLIGNNMYYFPEETLKADMWFVHFLLPASAIMEALETELPSVCILESG